MNPELSRDGAGQKGICSVHAIGIFGCSQIKPETGLNRSLNYFLQHLFSSSPGSLTELKKKLQALSVRTL